jgi:glycosyltransferase involved in cell wall biosynthesis
MSHFIEEIPNFIDQIKEIKKIGNGKNLEVMPFQTKTADKTITFLYSIYNRESLSTIFNIYWALNRRSNKYKVFLSQIADDDKKDYSTKNWTVNWSTYLSSDIIVIPFVTEDIEGFIETVKSDFELAKKKKIIPQDKNPEFCYLVDFDFINISKDKAQYHNYKNKEVHEAIIKNIKQVDRVIFRTKELYDHLFEELKPKITGCGTICTYFAPFVNWDLIESFEYPEIDEEEKKQVKIGILVNESNKKDVRSIAKHLEEWQKENPFKLKLYAYGEEESNPKLILKGVDFTFVSEGSIDTYYKELLGLNCSAFIIPTNDNKWNQYHYEVERVLDLWALKVPVIVSDMDPINKYVLDEETGYVYSSKDHLKRILTVIKDMDHSEDSENQLFRMKNEAFKRVKERDSLQEQNIDFIERIFD